MWNVEWWWWQSWSDVVTHSTSATAVAVLNTRQACRVETHTKHHTHVLYKKHQAIPDVPNTLPASVRLWSGEHFGERRLPNFHFNHRRKSNKTYKPNNTTVLLLLDLDHKLDIGCAVFGWNWVCSRQTKHAKTRVIRGQQSTMRWRSSRCGMATKGSRNRLSLWWKIVRLFRWCA